MLTTLLTDPTQFFAGIIALLVAITIHEFAHAFAADRLGDPTPRVQGRLTLNPLAHLDPLGTLMLILVRFGWGKPVQFDPYNLENPRRDAAIISVAGPVSNLIVATITAIALRLLFHTGYAPELFGLFAFQLIYLNVILAVFNLIPIHPLDGGKILIGLLPPDLAPEWDQILNRYGIFILIFLVFPIFGGEPIVSRLIGPLINLFINILLPTPSLI